MTVRALSTVLDRMFRVTPLGLVRDIDRPGERRAAGMVLLSTGMAIVVIWVIATAALYQTRVATIRDQKSDLERMARVAEEQTRNELTKIQLLLSMIDIYYQKNKSVDPLRDPSLERFIQQLNHSSQNHIDVRLVTTQGDLYLPGGEETIPLANVADRDYVLAQKDQETRGLFIGKPVASRIDNRWVLPISYPLTGSPGDILLLSADIDGLTLEKHYEAGRPQPNGSIVLTHRDGTVLVRAPGQQLPPGTSLAQGVVWKQGLKNDLKGVQYIEISLLDGLPRLAAFIAMQDFPLVVIVTEPIDDVLAHWRKFMGVILRIGALLTAVVLLLAHHLILRIRELSLTRNELELMAQTDPLTGMFNRRQFWLLGAREIVRVARYGGPLAVLAIDLDHFKHVNDTYGHAAGDDALRWFANRLKETLRQTDVAARIGGEEFAVLLPETSIGNAQHLAERIRTSLVAAPVISGDITFPLTASFGVAGTTDSAETLENLLARADRALYRAKESGRNRTVVAEFLETGEDQTMHEIQNGR